MDKNLARFLGYIISEGRTNLSNQVWFVNEDEALIKDFCKCSQEIFGLKPKIFSYKNSAKDVIIFSSMLCKFLDKVFGIRHGGSSREKTIPSQMFSASQEIIIEFISALFEGDAYFKNKIEKKRNNFYIEYSTASRELAYGLSTLLLRLGVQALIRKREKYASNTDKKIRRIYYSVYIYGIANIKRIAPFLNLVGKKKNILKEINKINSGANPNLDIIPGINPLIKRFIKSSKINVKKARKISAKLAAYYEDRCLPSRQGVLETIKYVEENSSFYDSTLKEKLKNLACSDIYWDEITGIEKVASDTEWVYDLCIEDNHNFIADNFIAHNSNVFDSIKWALGEQSPKSLRGAKMEDVIFNGTESHPPLNYAEVSLTFCNEDKYLPIDYKEVSVARRLYRSGESQYFINKNIVRLKDVQELFMGTGIGESTYSFIEQGKIEIFLSYKPEDKRLIFDEASGIVKYKERKKETLRRLDETEENLLRLEDIMVEVRRQIRYLERQVEKAKKYKEVQQQLIEVEKKIASLQFSDLGVKINKILDELNVFKEKEQDKQTQLNGINNKWEELNSSLRALRAKLEEAATTVASLRARIDGSNSHINFLSQRIKEVQGRSINLVQAHKNLVERLELQDKRSQQETEHMQEIETAFGELDEQLVNLDTEKKGLLENIEEAKKIINQEKTKILDSEGRKTQSHNTLIEIQTKLSSLINRKKRLTLDKAKLETMAGENKDKFSIAKQELDSAKQGLSILQEDKNSLTRKDKDVVSNLEESKQKLIDQEKELLELRASFEFLKDLRIKYETFSSRKIITVIFDEEPGNINKLVASLQDAEFKQENGVFKARIEAKVISFEEKQLEDKINSVQNSIQQMKGGLEGLEQRRRELSEEIETKNENIEEARKVLQEKSQEEESLRREAERLNEEFELILDEEKTTSEDIQDCQQKQNQTQEELDVFQKDLDKANQTLSSAQAAMTEGFERIKDIDIEATKSHSQKQSLQKEKEALISQISFFKDEIKNIQTSLEQIDKEKQDGTLQVSSFQDQIKQLKEKIDQDEEKISEMKNTKSGLEEEELALNEQVEQIKQLGQKIEKESQEINSSAYNKKLEIQSLEYEKEKIKDYLRQVYNIEFSELSPEEIGSGLDVLIPDKERMQKRVKSLGEVNLVAIEEFEELKKREDFLETQKQDLVTSKENLKKAIQKINRTSKELFLETFTKIETEFKKNFKFLFNGGRANLILIDQDNILESGVEIEVQPPGKKLQNVSLLSGGEKALTAIALIFAIFCVRPSPLCALDEIDAPLDEANVDRFNHLLKEFSDNSQFILITHNKRSMSNADVLYGVTMQEKGISKLVSVKFAAEAEEVAS